MVESANYFLTQPTVSVMSKSSPPASGDKHDYLSISMYHWPDPAKSNGLPWVYRDGLVNRERVKLSRDSDFLSQTMSRIRVLGLTFAITHDEKYAIKGTDLARSWFFASATRMNPNLNFAQVIPGSGPFKSFGIIEGVTLVQTLDALRFLESSAKWTKQDTAEIRKWMSD